MMNKSSGMLIAATAAALFASMSTTVFAEDTTTQEVKCAGINSCKGTSKCATAENACAGQNSCKGHGWINTATEKECTDKGGNVIK